MFVDTMFYAVIAPLLPTLVHQLHLSKLSAGVMTASYPPGALLGSLPGGMLAARAGPRPTVVTGLALLAASTVAFALLHSAVALDTARFVEGIGGACSWAGGLAWIVAETPSERRGALIGRALGAAIGGTLFGPVIGTLATTIGRRAAFSAVVVIALLLIAETRGLPSSHVQSHQGIGVLRVALRQRSITTGMWLVCLPALASGALSVLAPLRLHHFGASAAAIGATFLSQPGWRQLSHQRSDACQTGVGGSCPSDSASQRWPDCSSASASPALRSFWPYWLSRPSPHSVLSGRRRPRCSRTQPSDTSSTTGCPPH
ncbi:MAG: MFS transporter [Actinomycetota bacterium]|nr:MFS transporter [Actinomycetota bacterium]